MSTENLFNVTIAHPSKALFKGAVRMITVPTTEGEMTLLAHHTPIIIELKKGTITVQGGTTDEKIQFEIKNGVLEVSNNTATVLL